MKVDRIEPLFTMRFPYGAYHAFDVTKDGQRFLGEHGDHVGRRAATGGSEGGSKDPQLRGSTRKVRQ